MAEIQLTSPELRPDEFIPSEFTCDAGENVSPPLKWGAPPAGTKSFAVVVDDPDAPNGTFEHWGVYDLPASARELAAGAGAAEAPLKQVRNDFGKIGYGAPCPPTGDEAHGYVFRVLALDIAHLPGEPVDVAGILSAADGHVLASGRFVWPFGMT